MRAAVILGLGCSPKHLKPFQADQNQFTQKIEWHMGLPASADAADVILLFGGDGTIHRHLAPLIRLGLPVLVVPVGSGNDFARAIGLPRVRDSLTAWRKFCGGAENIRAIDLGMISEVTSASSSTFNQSSSNQPSQHESSRNSAFATYDFCCVASVGLDAEVSRRANQLPRWLRGHGGYTLTLIPSIFRFAPLSMKISKPAGNRKSLQSTDHGAGSLSDQLTILTAFANTPFYGGGMKIAPQARMDDGLLDVCIVGGMNPFKLFCMFPTVYGGRHLKIPEVEYFQAGRVRVETEHPLDVYADGEYVCRTPVDVGVKPSALKIVGP